MFPIAHWYFGRQLAGGVYDPLFALGGTLPDLGRSMGLDRNEAHSSCCRVFYRYALTQAPELKPAALGMLGHGIDPHCVDYYADEHWLQGPRGWCFQQGASYIPQVIAACGLPEEWGLWKSHNLVEMACELTLEQQHPQLSQELLQAAQDQAAQKVLAQGLSRCFGLEEQRVRRSLAMLPEIFAIDRPTAASLGEKYRQSLFRIHQIQQADAEAIAALICQIQQEKGADFWPWAKQVSDLVSANLTAYQQTVTQD